jgi:tungstate transport system substrate-binding protein
MYNHFVILGPADDPASVNDAPGVLDAFRRIAKHGRTPFVTRGDRSGTHMREQSIWQAAGLQPEGSWYLDAGQGMAACIGIANEKNAYTLSDRGTFLSMRDRLGIEVLFEADSLLLNPYSIIAVNPKRRPGGNHEGAQRLIAWLTSVEGQQTIASFRVSGEALFHPDAQRHTGAVRDPSVSSKPETSTHPDAEMAEEP